MNDHRDRPDPDAMGNSLRDELRVGVRMMKALETQLERAERILQLESDATRRADETMKRLRRETQTLETADRDAADRAPDHDAIMHRLEGLARDLGARLDSQAVRLAEIDATVTTLERRIDHLATHAPTTVHPSASTASGSLSLEPASRPEEIERPQDTLRNELEGIRRASASLAEAVEAADRTDASLRRTLAAATNLGVDESTGRPHTTTRSLTTILRRLADEFDAAASPGAASTSKSMATLIKPASGIEVESPLVLDLTPSPDEKPTVAKD